MRRLFNHFIASLRERPFSYKTAYCRELAEVPHIDPQRLRDLYDGTEYLVGRVVLTDVIRRHRLPVPMTFVRHVVETATRYQLKNVMLLLRRRSSLRTLVRVAKHRLSQEDPLMRFLLIQAARAQEIDPNNLQIYANTEQAEFSEEEMRTWRLWRPLDDLIEAVNEAAEVAPDTLRLMLWENRPALAEELARDLADVFNIAPEEIDLLPPRRLASLLAKYVDLSYLLCQGLREGDFRPFELRLAEESRIQPPGVLLPPESTEKPTPPQRMTGKLLSRGNHEAPEEVFPEEQMLMPPAEEGPESPPRPAPVRIEDIAFDPAWIRWVPRTLAEELLIIPLHVEGDPPRHLTVGCGHGEHSVVIARLRALLGCVIHCVGLPERTVREAIRKHYRT